MSTYDLFDKWTCYCLHERLMTPLHGSNCKKTCLWERAKTLRSVMTRPTKKTSNLVGHCDKKHNPCEPIYFYTLQIIHIIVVAYQSIPMVMSDNWILMKYWWLALPVINTMSCTKNRWPTTTHLKERRFIIIIITWMLSTLLNYNVLQQWS